jgi:PhzF family phenazine biosynthesis protein
MLTAWNVVLMSLTAGHPTIGTLCYIAQEELGGKDANIRLQLKAGLVEAKYDASTKRAVAAVPHKVNIHAHKIEAAELYMYQTDLAKDSIKPFNDVVSIVRGMTFAMIPLPTLDELGRVQIPAEAINMVFDAGWDDGFVGQMWFVDLGAGADGVRNLRTRMMSSRSMGEDAATGSASCGLGVYLALKDGKGDGEYKFAMTQGVEMGRKSEISIRVMLDASGKSVETVELGGSAVTVMRGEMDVA